MFNDKDEGLSNIIESYVNNNDNDNDIDNDIDNNLDNNGNVDERITEIDQRIDARDENEDQFSALQNTYPNDERLEFINGISNISSNNPSNRSYQISDDQRLSLTENSSHGVSKMSMTEVTSVTKK